MQATIIQNLLVLLLLHLSRANAVTIQNWRSEDCLGNARSCSNIASDTCCQSLTRSYSSSRFIGIIESELGAVCTPKGSAYCGTIRAANSGSKICVNKPTTYPISLRGSFWYSCLSCMKRDIANSSESVGAQFVDQPSFATRSVLPDKVVIDGHKFEVNHPNQTQQISDTLDALVDSENPVYDTMDADLLRWEVPMSPADY